MLRPLAIVAAAALAGAAALVPLTAALAETSPSDLTPTPTASAQPTPGPGSPTPVPGAPSMTLYPANPVAAPGNPAHATATWVNGTLRVVFDWAMFPFPMAASDEDIAVYVDDVRIPGPEMDFSKGQVASVPRAASAGPAHVVIESTGSIERGSWYDLERAWLFEATVSQRRVTAKPGQVSARTLLGRLKVAKETRAPSSTSARFGSWIDADHDGESTRTEVLKAESRKKVVERHGVVTAGRWVSAYDGTTVTSASKVVIDRTVPLQEAWTSGAAAWSGAKRAAYANDLGYGPSLVAVSTQAARAKGSKEPDAYLPSATASTCTYVKHWIAVKYRWGLSVDAAEQHAVTADLARCANPYVAKPGKPDVSRLVGR